MLRALAERRKRRDRFTTNPNPLRLYRVMRLAELFDVNPATIWRWRKNGTLPPPVEISSGVRGWLESDILDLIEARRQEAGR